MLILLDEDLPRRLARHLPGHEVRTVQQLGWAGIANGELLRRAAAAGFEVLLTADQNLTFQQHLAASTIRVVVMAARSNRLEDLLPLLPLTLEAIREMPAGQIRVLRMP